MTVKATLAYGRNFHFYHEGLDNNHVYLELEDVPYDAGYRRVMIAIPIDVWEVIRSLAPAKLDLVDATDEDLIRLAEESVNKRIVEFERLKESSPMEAASLRFNNAEAFGAADTQREQQLAKGIDYFRTERDRQRDILFRISQHKIVNLSTEHFTKNDL